MGFFDSLFGGNKDYPSLDQSSRAAGQLESLGSPLAEIAGSINDQLEVIPADNGAYIFFGKPPKKFGVVWIEEDGKVVNFKSLVQEKGLSEVRLGMLSQKLGEIYKAHKDEDRFTTRTADREIVVIPSPALFNGLKEVVAEAIG